MTTVLPGCGGLLVVSICAPPTDKSINDTSGPYLMRACFNHDNSETVRRRCARRSAPLLLTACGSSGVELTSLSCARAALGSLTILLPTRSANRTPATPGPQSC